MTYVPTIWEDEVTAVDAARMNHLESGVAGALAVDSPVSGGVPVWNGSGWVSSVGGNLGNVEPWDVMVNGSLGIWERGAGPFTADGAFCADGWQLAKGAGSTLQVDQDTLNPQGANSGRCMKVTYVHGGVESRVRNAEAVADSTPLRGMHLTLRSWVKASVPNAVRMGLTNGVTTDYSTYHSGGGGYEHLTCYLAPDDTGGQVVSFLSLMGSGTFYLDNADLLIGRARALPDTDPFSAPQFSRDSTIENHRANRLYQKIEVNAQFVAAAPGHIWVFPIYLRHQGYNTISVAVQTVGTRTNIGAPAYVMNKYGGKVTLTASAAGYAGVAGEIVEVVSSG